jgi:hypothetical protein
MSEPCENPLCQISLNGDGRKTRRFCSDRCRLVGWILKKAAELLAPLEQSRAWEILFKLTHPAEVEK